MENEVKRMEREIIEGSDAQQEAYREMAKAGWKADEIYQDQRKKGSTGRKNEKGKKKAPEELHQNMATKEDTGQSFEKLIPE